MHHRHTGLEQANIRTELSEQFGGLRIPGREFARADFPSHEV